MGEISFDEETVLAPVYATKRREGLVGLVKKVGLAKTDKDAERILIGTLVVSACLAALILFSVYAVERKPPPLPPVPLGTKPYAP